jgi:hypothetical protein
MLSGCWYCFCSFLILVANVASTHHRSCINTPNKFCYGFGQFIVISQSRSLKRAVKKAYVLYFGCPVGDQDKFGPRMCVV